MKDNEWPKWFYADGAYVWRMDAEHVGVAFLLADGIPTIATCSATGLKNDNDVKSIPSAEGERLVAEAREKAEEAAKWAAGSRWTWQGNGFGVCEWHSSNTRTVHFKTGYTEKQTTSPFGFRDNRKNDITPSRAAEIIAEWAKEWEQQPDKYRPWKNAAEALGQKVRLNDWVDCAGRMIISAGRLRVRMLDIDGPGIDRIVSVDYATLLRDWQTIDGQKCGVKL